VLQVSDVRVREMRPLVPPGELKRALPLPAAVARAVIEARQTVERILAGEDPRLLVVVGPCSIHDEAAATEYAHRLQRLRLELGDALFLLMRVYFEKPRTTTGWKGLIYDPGLDGSEDLACGLQVARRLLLQIAALGVPAGTEMLDPITPQYLADLIAWASIGARTTESQTHREMASGLSMPVGFKNSTDGNLQVALDALISARHPHSFLGIDQEGRTCVVRTSGNPWGHLVLRGGTSGPNYYPECVEDAAARLRDAGLRAAILVDCSHANSGKRPARQERVLQSVVGQRLAGEESLIGVMLESNLEEGSQPLAGRGPGPLRYGVSITDACIGWETTERLLRWTHGQLTAA